MGPKNSSNVNSFSKRTVLYICGTTGDQKCTSKVLNINSVGSTNTSYNSIISSVMFIPTNEYVVDNIFSNSTYIYLFISIGDFNGYWHSNITFTNTVTNDSVIIPFSNYFNGQECGIPILSDTIITNYNETGNYYTINPGTYILSYNGQIGNTFTFSDITFDVNGNPKQTITINNS